MRVHFVFCPESTHRLKSRYRREYSILYFCGSEESLCNSSQACPETCHSVSVSVHAPYTWQEEAVLDIQTLLFLTVSVPQHCLLWAHIHLETISSLWKVQVCRSAWRPSRGGWYPFWHEHTVPRSVCSRHCQDMCSHCAGTPDSGFASWFNCISVLHLLAAHFSKYTNIILLQNCAVSFPHAWPLTCCL